MSRRVALFVVACALFLATDLWAAMFVCPKDESQFVQKKHEMLQKFKNCQKEYSVNSVSVSTGVPGLSVKVWEGESGVEDRLLCLEAYTQEIALVEHCLQAVLPGKNFFSRDEYAGLLLNREQISEYWQLIDRYATEARPRTFESVIDRFDTKNEEVMFKTLSETRLVDGLNTMSLSREDKDVAILYFRYLMSTYNYEFFHKRNDEWYSGLGWLDQEKKNFLEKYPNSRHRAFVEREMIRIYPTEEEKIEMGTEKVRQQIAKKAVWMSLSMFGIVGLPLMDGYDTENVDIPALFSLGLKYQFRFLSAQYEYFFSCGGNSHDGAFSEKGMALMLGFSAGSYRRFNIDFLLGLSLLDVYPNKEDLPIQKNAVYPRTAIQGSVFFPIAESWDMFLHTQFSLGLNPAGSYSHYHEEDEVEVGFMGVVSVGIGFRFWKPRPVSSYPEKYTKNL